MTFFSLVQEKKRELWCDPSIKKLGPFCTKSAEYEDTEHSIENPKSVKNLQEHNLTDQDNSDCLDLGDL